MLFNIKHGTSAKLASAQKIQGCWYVTDDTFQLYYCPDGEQLVLMNEMEPFDPSGINAQIEELQTQVTEIAAHRIFKSVSTVLDLPITGKVNIVYYVEDEHTSYMWSSEASKYQIVGTDHNTIERISGGDAGVIIKNSKTI